MGLAIDSVWQAIASAALLGTGRQPFQVPLTPGPLGQVLTPLTDRSAEASLLSAAATVALHQRVGWLPETRSLPSTQPSPSDDRPRCSARAAYCLQQLLEGQSLFLLPEWLDQARTTGQRVPEMMLPALLTRGRQQPELRPAILPVLGQRGEWLAAQNPDWSYAIVHPTEAAWETGTSTEREMLLHHLRGQSPDRARDLLQTTWSQETAGDRTKFLETFYRGLSLADEPFLEMALGDRRSKEVRRVASDLLAHLPESRLCQHMSEAIQPYVTLTTDSSSTLIVRLPESLDPSLIQLGIDPKFSPQPAFKLGEKAGWLLQMLGATPLSYWNQAWGMTAPEMIHLTRRHEWEAALLQGWALAAQRQGDRPWILALLKRGTAVNPAGHPLVLAPTQLEALFTHLPLEQQTELLLDLMQPHRDAIGQPLMLLLLCHCSGSWSADLTQVVLAQLEACWTGTLDLGKRAVWELHPYIQEFARFMPVHCLPEIRRLQTQLPAGSVWLSSVDALLSILQFRQEMMQAFEKT